MKNVPMITPENVIYYSLILQLLDSGADLNHLTPGTRAFLETFYLQWLEHAGLDEPSSLELFHYCDKIFNEKRKLH